MYGATATQECLCFLSGSLKPPRSSKLGENPKKTNIGIVTIHPEDH